MRALSLWHLLPYICAVIAGAVVAWRLIATPGPVVGGWKSLARSYHVDELPSGERFRSVSALIGNERAPVRYRNLLSAVVNPTGLGLSIRSVFGQAPAIFIPWTHVESAARSEGLLANTVLFRVRSQWPTIALYGQAGLSALHAYDQSAFKREL
jgi:hypothetical protein